MLAVGSLVIADGLLQFLYHLKNNEYTWEIIDKVEVFNIQYLTPVQDERYVVPDISYSDEYVMFDEYGFRKTPGVNPSKTEKNIIFLGDSILFGYLATAGETVPSRVSNMLGRAGLTVASINAAVPSYSLNQAVYRYIYDIEGKFPEAAIVLQAYDPAENFYWLGHKWDVTKNWYTSSARHKIGAVKRMTDSRLRYSFMYYLFWRYSGLFFEPLNGRIPYDEADLDRLRESITLSLDTLLAHTRSHIFLVALSRPLLVMKEISQEELRPITLLNETLRTYATTHDRVHFVDIRGEFANYPDEEVFLDVCCHFTSKGLELEAVVLSRILEKFLRGERLQPVYDTIPQL